MTKSLSVVLSSLLVVVALTTGVQASDNVTDGAGRGQRRGSRTIELRYEGGAVPYAFCVDCPGLTPLPGERFMSVEVIDDVSPLASLDVSWTTYNPDDPGYFSVCGRTEEPQRIPPSADLNFHPWMIPGSPWLDDPAGGCTEGFSISGTIKVTFMSRLPR